MPLQTLKRALLGQPISNERAHEERLIKTLALAVFSSDVMSSVAYATEEILIVLVLAGAGALNLSLPIAVAIVALLAMLTISYRQIITAYPTGGGAYIVATDNFGHKLGLVAGSSLLIDYVLTVSVSIASGVAAITSAIPSLFNFRVELGAAFILLIMLANLRGIRDSGKIFAIPTYSFLLGMVLLIGFGFFKHYTGYTFVGSGKITHSVFEPLGAFLILRAFSSGCVAITGTEAISNGVPAFRKPESKNARITLTLMSFVMGVTFFGITQLARYYHIVPNPAETVLSQLARGIFGVGAIYFYIQAATTMILVVAANTSFADFPRVASLMAKDGFLPRQLMNKGNRLAFSNGILMLALFSILLIVIFGGDTNRLIPLYAIGVFTSFTLSQSGMVRHWFKERGKGWIKKTIINGLGAVTTFTVLVVVSVTKFMHGAWIVILVIPILITIFLIIKRHYSKIAKQLSLGNLRPPKPIKNWVILCIGGVHCGTLQAVRYAKMISDNQDLIAMYINTQDGEPTDIIKKWEQHGFSTPLEIIRSPYRDIITPIIKRVEQIHEGNPDDFVTVVVPEFIVRSWWERLLHNQTALLLKMRLMFMPNVIVTSVPYQLF